MKIWQVRFFEIRRPASVDLQHLVVTIMASVSPVTTFSDNICAIVSNSSDDLPIMGDHNWFWCHAIGWVTRWHAAAFKLLFVDRYGCLAYVWWNVCRRWTPRRLYLLIIVPNLFRTEVIIIIFKWEIERGLSRDVETLKKLRSFTV